MARYGHRRPRKPLDQMTAAQAFSQPGIDPRQWVSFGLVTAGDNPDVPEPVVFDEDEGQPLVRVTLEPSKVPVMCRVASMLAGDGEGEWNPLVVGDEVIVVIPEGDERAGGVILGKLNNRLDKFPFESVAGQDPKENGFAFRRRRTPYVEEFAGPILLRSALSEGFISLDAAGVITLKGVENVVLGMDADQFTVQGPSSDESPPEHILQINWTDSQFTLQVGPDTLLTFGESGTNLWKVPGALAISASGSEAAEHLVTTEALANILAAFAISVGAFVPATTPTLADPILAGVFAAALSSGSYASFPLTQAAVFSGFAAHPPKPPASPTTGQIAPGLGCPGLLAG